MDQLRGVDAPPATEGPCQEPLPDPNCMKSACVAADKDTALPQQRSLESQTAGKIPGQGGQSLADAERDVPSGHSAMDCSSKTTVVQTDSGHIQQTSNRVGNDSNSNSRESGPTSELGPASFAEAVQALDKAISVLPAKCRQDRCRCRTAVSTALHGLQLCAASSIPNPPEAWLAYSVHELLAQLAAALLEGEHAPATLRATYEAFDLMVSHLQLSSQNRPGSNADSTAASNNSDAGTADTTHGSGNSSGSDAINSSRGSGTGGGSFAAVQSARLQVAVALSKQGLLEALRTALQVAKGDWQELHAVLVDLERSLVPVSEHETEAATDAELEAKLLKAQHSPPCSVSQDLYHWVNTIVNIWPNDVLAAPAAAKGVFAAADTAAYHLQCLTDMQRVNALLTKQRMSLTAPLSPAGVVGAIQFCRTAVAALVSTLLAGQHKQEQAGQPLSAVLASEHVPAAVRWLVKDQFQQLIVLCATSLACDGLHEWQQQQQQCLGYQGEEVVPGAKAESEGGGADSSAAASSSNATSKQGMTAGRAGAAGTCSAAGSSHMGRQQALTAAAAEEALLQSAKQLYAVPAPWLSGLPDWAQLLQRGWQGMGFPLELLTGQAGQMQGCSSSGSAGTDSSSGVLGIGGSIASANTDSSCAGPNTNSSSGGLSTDGSGNSNPPAAVPVLFSTKQSATNLAISSKATMMLLHELVEMHRAASPSSSGFVKAQRQGQLGSAHFFQLPTLVLGCTQAHLQASCSHVRLSIAAWAADVVLALLSADQGWVWGVGKGRMKRREYARGSAKQRKAIWIILGQVLLLLKKVLSAAADLQERLKAPQQPVGASTVRLHAQQCEAVKSCLLLLTTLLCNRDVWWDIDSAQQCQRMADVLQLVEAALRFLATPGPAAARQQQQQQQRAAPTGAAAAAAATAAAAVAAATTAAAADGAPNSAVNVGVPYLPAVELQQHAAAIEPAVLVDLVAKVLEAVTYERNAYVLRSWRRQSTRLQRQVARVQQAGISVLLTAVKLPQAPVPALFCDAVGWALLDLACGLSLQHAGADGASVAPEGPQQPIPQQQEQKQQRQPSASHAQQGQLQAQEGGQERPGTSQHVSQQHATTLRPQQAVREPHAAVTALVGRHLLLVGAELQRLAAAGDGGEACEWLLPQMMIITRGESTSKVQVHYHMYGSLPEVLKMLPGGAPDGAGVSTAGGSTGSVFSSSRGNGGSNCSRGGQSSGSSSASAAAAGLHTPVDCQFFSWPVIAVSDVETDRLLQALQAMTGSIRDLTIQHHQAYTGSVELQAAAQQLDKEVAAARGKHKALTPAAKLSLKHKVATLAQNKQRQQHLQQQLAECEAAVAAALPEYGSSLQRLGEVLCAQVPTRFCCNNPHCSNMATVSESFALVRGNSCVCGGCLGGIRRPTAAPTYCCAARYCCANCQESHRQQHKPTCQLMQRAAGQSMPTG